MLLARQFRDSRLGIVGKLGDSEMRNIDSSAEGAHEVCLSVCVGVAATVKLYNDKSESLRLWQVNKLPRVRMFLGQPTLTESWRIL